MFAGGLLTAEYLKLHCEPVNWSFSSRNSIFDRYEYVYLFILQAVK